MWAAFPTPTCCMLLPAAAVLVDTCRCVSVSYVGRALARRCLSVCAAVVESLRISHTRRTSPMMLPISDRFLLQHATYVSCGEKRVKDDRGHSGLPVGRWAYCCCCAAAVPAVPPCTFATLLNCMLWHNSSSTVVPRTWCFVIVRSEEAQPSGRRGVPYS